MTMPSYKQVLELPSQVEREVPPSFEDGNGHMNIRHYLELSASAAEVLLERVGVDDDYRGKRGLGVFTAEHHLRYLAETAVGESISVHAMLLERSSSAIHGMAFLLNRTRRLLSHTFEVTLVHVSLTTRRPTRMPDDIAVAVDKEIARDSSITWDPPVSGLLGVRRRRRLDNGENER